VADPLRRRCAVRIAELVITENLIRRAALNVSAVFIGLGISLPLLMSGEFPMLNRALSLEVLTQAQAVRAPLIASIVSLTVTAPLMLTRIRRTLHLETIVVPWTIGSVVIWSAAAAICWSRSAIAAPIVVSLVGLSFAGATVVAGAKLQKRIQLRRADVHFARQIASVLSALTRKSRSWLQIDTRSSSVAALEEAAATLERTLPIAFGLAIPSRMSG
jgi:hypothetical protein